MTHFQPTARGESLDEVCIRHEIIQLNSELHQTECPKARRKILSEIEMLHEGLMHHIDTSEVAA